MFSLPIASLISTGFYFSAMIFFASALLLLALYHFRWKSDDKTLGFWLVTFVIAGLISWLISNNFTSLLITLVIYLFLILFLLRFRSVISLFGVFFLASMLAPSVFGLFWLYELGIAASRFLNSGWLINSFLLIIGILLSVLIVFNTVMLSWIVLVRYSSLYFNFPRLLEAWKNADNTAKKYPWVSIHVACYNEPPEVVIETLNALANLQYPHFEVIVLDNNTKDSTIWKPIEKHCLHLGERFRFYHIDSLPGAKAGALNKCLKLTSPQVEMISVMDADYVIKPDFLEKLTPFLQDKKVGFVQSCQDYRDWKNNSYQAACYFEYETHFKLELCGQNEWDVTYTIGTMCLIRRKALEEAGGWAEWCLTEDSEVAVRIHALGYCGYYLNNTFGYGLIPETFEGYKQQRFRWTAGPVQQFQKHWRYYMPWSSKGQLTIVQKFGEIFHSLSTFFSEFLNILINVPILAFCLWSIIAKGQSFSIPFSVLFFIPFAMMRNVICNWLSIKLLGGNFKNYILSVMAARSLVFTRNIAFFKALRNRHLKWKRTDKFKEKTNFLRAFQSSQEEITMAAIYLLLSCFLGYFASFRHPDIIFMIWLGILNQAFSFLCAPIMSLLSEKNLKH
jgi:cellulose synthase/poly-beta-1,6-N-acetylglucosamine synthase-like glycosyltransferase